MVAGHPGPLFQYHHQPFNYFANYAAGAPGRSHLQDETTFIASAKNGTLPQVSFVKPYGAETTPADTLLALVQRLLLPAPRPASERAAKAKTSAG